MKYKHSNLEKELAIEVQYQLWLENRYVEPIIVDYNEFIKYNNTSAYLPEIKMPSARSIREQIVLDISTLLERFFRVFGVDTDGYMRLVVAAIEAVKRMFESEETDSDADKYAAYICYHIKRYYTLKLKIKFEDIRNNTELFHILCEQVDCQGSEDIFDYMYNVIISKSNPLTATSDWHNDLGIFT
jgi:hypothetical protein